MDSELFVQMRNMEERVHALEATVERLTVLESDVQGALADLKMLEDQLRTLEIRLARVGSGPDVY